ncbi:response regulator transcription factor [Balneolaceae bacterium YR4-1]|uniref:Response regulator transcription factor n=1 Tax=Halalkalibaculum roseum TaxID=2709311 RepID=A0A6M1SRA8_9BACT|nr:response regulator transcription factor [Halalkalibaculum roseum]NGP75350.1 response regulator transcription factor [Halalkalibaculum roseum]
MELVNIVIAEHHKIVRDGIKMILEDVPGIRVTKTVGNKEELLSYSCSEKNMVVILDLDMPDLDKRNTIKKLKEKNSNISILGISDIEDQKQIKHVIVAGVSGYILKKRGKEEIIKAIEVIKNGNQYLCEESIKALVHDNDGDYAFDVEDSSLTYRELEVLELICEEYTNKESADELGISVRTVDAHRRSLLQKTGAKNTAGLVKFAVRNHILSL